MGDTHWLWLVTRSRWFKVNLAIGKKSLYVMVEICVCFYQQQQYRVCVGGWVVILFMWSPQTHGEVDLLL